ncbi:MAG: associated Golgi protein, partial [Anaerocolumna sp.]|nr:associated Golgi protein [Anaerocolumna sp.]
VASIQNINYFVIVLLSIIAGIIGTTFCFYIGRLGGTALLDKIIKKFPKSEHGLKASQEKFKKYGGFAVCFGRLIPICRTYIAFIAGASGQNPTIYVLSSLVGISIWNSILIGLGYIMRENWDQAIGYYSRYKDVITPLLALILLFLISHFRGKKLNKS